MNTKMKHIHTFEGFLNEQEDLLNEDATAVFIVLQALMLTGPLWALAAKAGAFDDLKSPSKAFSDWKRDRIVSAAVERLNKDPEIQDFFSLPGSKQRGKWKELIASKLTDKEMKHINSISRYRVEDGKI